MVCENCGKIHDGSYGSGRFCSSICARSFVTKNDNKNEQKEAKCINCGKTIYINKRASINKCKCDKCKSDYILQNDKKIHIKSIKEQSLNFCKYTNFNCTEECYFLKHNICKGNAKSISQKIKILVQYFNLPLEIIGQYELLVKYIIELKNKIQTEINLGLSANELCKKYTGSYKKGNTIFKSLNIHTRNLSESVKNAILQNKLDVQRISDKYKTEWHITWDNKKYFLRSSYETDFANELDKKQISYEVESLRITYFDSQKKTNRIAIPDFYIIDTNTIVEIKSIWTLDIQNMKDKFKAYNDLGYNTKLICEHKELEIN